MLNTQIHRPSIVSIIDVTSCRVGPCGPNKPVALDTIRTSFETETRALLVQPDSKLFLLCLSFIYLFWVLYRVNH